MAWYWRAGDHGGLVDNGRRGRSCDRLGHGSNRCRCHRSRSVNNRGNLSGSNRSDSTWRVDRGNDWRSDAHGGGCDASWLSWRCVCLGDHRCLGLDKGSSGGGLLGDLLDRLFFFGLNVSLQAFAFGLSTGAVRLRVLDRRRVAFDADPEPDA